MNETNVSVSQKSEKYKLGESFIKLVAEGKMEIDHARNLFQVLVDNENITADEFVDLNKELTRITEGSMEDKREKARELVALFITMVNSGDMGKDELGEYLQLLVASARLTKDEANEYLKQVR